MASTQEVAVPVGEVVVVKAEGGGDPDDPSKAQVILQLQAISAGDEPAEAGAAVVAVEESAGQAEREEAEVGCPITCGDCKALLLMRKFVCPGINVKCVKYEDQLISPKQFVHMSGKATLKDWKRAIRMGGVMLRKMMDSGQLDFYQHSSLCTNTCRSTKFDLLISNTRFPPDGTGAGLATPTASQAPAVQGNGGEDQADAAGGKPDWGSPETSERKEPGEISEDALAFWRGIADVGLLGEVASSLSAELLRLLGGVRAQQEAAALQDAEVAVLSNLAQVFGLLDSVKRLLERRRQQTDPSQEQLLSTLTSLEEQLEEQQQQQQQQEEEARLAASCRGKTSGRRAGKRPRLQRPASTTATLLSSPVSQQPQFTVLSPISLASLGQPFSLAGLPLAGLAQGPGAVTLLPAGSQVFTRYMVAADGKSDTFTLHPSSGLTLVGGCGGGVPEPGQLGAVVSPLELVQLSQQPEVVPVDGAVLLQQEVEPGQEHTVIQINPGPAEQELGLMALRLEPEAGREQAAGEGPPEASVPGLQLDAGGPLSTVQILVLGDAPQEDRRAKETH